jgi:hypothetical protein
MFDVHVTTLPVTQAIWYRNVRVAANSDWERTWEEGHELISDTLPEIVWKSS